jgi:hypothetical protein
MWRQGVCVCVGIGSLKQVFDLSGRCIGAFRAHAGMATLHLSPIFKSPNSLNRVVLTILSKKGNKSLWCAVVDNALLVLGQSSPGSKKHAFDG